MSSRKVNVLFLLNSLSIGGAEKHVVSLLNNLSRESFTLSLCYLKSDDSLLSQIDKALMRSVFSCNVEKKVDLKAAKDIASYIDASDIDVLVSTNTYPLIYSYLGRCFANRKPAMIDVFHTTKLFSLKSQIQMRFFRTLFKRQDAIIYVCEAQREYWKSRGLRAKVDRVIHNGIDANWFRDVLEPVEKSKLRNELGVGEQEYVVGICAALRPEKAHEDLLKAIVNLHRRGIKAKCLIIGDGVERQKIEQKIASMNLRESVIITGFIEDVRPLIAICDVMAIVSHAVETFSIAALEAMSLRKPMVMSDIGGAREQVFPEKNGHVYPAGDIDALTDALEDMSDKGKCARYGDESRKLVEENYTLQIMVDQFDNLLAEYRAD